MSVIQTAIQHPESIAYLSGANNYSWLHFRTGEKKLLAKPLGYLEQLLPDFVRVHKTALVNPAYISSLEQPPRKKMSGKVFLDTGESFPVSRRRWSQLVEALQIHPVLRDQGTKPASEQETPPPAQPSVGEPIDPSTNAIFLITDAQQDILLAEQTVAARWPGYVLHVRQQSALLPELLQQLPEEDYPVLILLDARTSGVERMNTLRRLKSDARYAVIPAILLVQPADQSIINGYQNRANSVIALPPDYTLFGEIFDRVCQFWLRMATLPRVRSQQE